MADVDAVSAVELFGAHLTGAATHEFAQILFDSCCAAKLYVDIDALFNDRPSQTKPTPYSKDLLLMH